MKRWLHNYGFQLSICLIFVGLAGYLVNGRIKYWDVKNWPSVPAQVFGETGQVLNIHGTNRYGSSVVRSVDQRSAEFRYQIGNDVYFATTISPNGGGLPLVVGLPQWRAHYKRSEPEIAVLIPESFGSDGLILVTVFSGILAFGCIWFPLRDWIQKREGENQKAITGRDSD